MAHIIWSIIWLIMQMMRMSDLSEGAGEKADVESGRRGEQDGRQGPSRRNILLIMRHAHEYSGHHPKIQRSHVPHVTESRPLQPLYSTPGSAVGTDKLP